LLKWLSPAVCAALLALPALGQGEFVDRTEDLGLALNTNAACWLDFDGKGGPDLVAGGALWRNEGGAGFVRIADAPPSVAADFDGDGWADLFSWTNMTLYRNAGGGSALEPLPLPDHPPTVSRAACWADLDTDGLVDLYVGGYENWDDQITYPDMVFMNQGDGQFDLAWTDDSSRARGVTACDFDEDGDPDVYVSNYRLQPNLLWVNDGQGGLTERAAEYGVVATSEGFAGGHSIGACWGDFDGDGHFDLFAGNFAHVDNRGDQPKSRFLRNLGPEGGYRFQDVGTGGIAYQESYATPAAADYDNDGDLDLFFTTVYGTASFGVANHPVLYRNDGHFTFTDVTAEVGLGGLPPTYQAAWADYDGDGDMDLMAGGRLFENRVAQGHWIGLRLRGGGETVNTSAVGAQARVTLPDRVLARQVEAGTGEGNQSSPYLHFGLGDYAGPVTIDILWPGGYRTGPHEVLEVDRYIDYAMESSVP
jgi:hypothetical protein